MSTELEPVIFANLFNNDDYFARVFPYMKADYFSDVDKQIIFKVIQRYTQKYNKVPKTSTIKLLLDRIQMDPDVYKECLNTLDSIKYVVPEDLKFLVDQTENFCQTRSVVLATEQALEIIENSKLDYDNRNKKVSTLDSLPDIFKKALSESSFNTDLGMDYFEDYEERFKIYTENRDKIPFETGMDQFNKMTNGGIERATLNVLMLPPNAGKSAIMCSLASSYLIQGYNVLYVSLEMSDMKVGQRVDANLMNRSMDDFKEGGITFDWYESEIKRIRSRAGQGKLKVKRFPTSSMNANHLRSLLMEYELKQNFKPDIIFVDYLGIAASTRIKYVDNSYALIKAISEEMRAIAVEFNVAMWSGSQVVRSAIEASDIDMGDIAGSIGLADTVDLLWAGIATEALEEEECLLIKQLKSRYADKTQIPTTKTKFYRSKQQIVARDFEKENKQNDFQKTIDGGVDPDNMPEPPDYINNIPSISDVDINTGEMLNWG